MIVQTIGVVGCGQMGAGIAEVSVLAGYDVIIYGRNEDIRPACRAGSKQSLAAGRQPRQAGGAARPRPRWPACAAPPTWPTWPRPIW